MGFTGTVHYVRIEHQGAQGTNLPHHFSIARIICCILGILHRLRTCLLRQRNVHAYHKVRSRLIRFNVSINNKMDASFSPADVTFSQYPRLIRKPMHNSLPLTAFPSFIPFHSPERVHLGTVFNCGPEDSTRMRMDGWADAGDALNEWKEGHSHAYMEALNCSSTL